VQYVATSDRVARDHRDDRLREPPDLDLEVEHVEATDALLVNVAIVASDLLIAARGERLCAFPGEDDDADRRVVPGHLEGLDQLACRERSEGVAHLRAVDGDLRDPVGVLVADVGPFTLSLPLDHVTINS